MKFILEEKDLKNIDNINKDLQDGINIPLFVTGDPGRKYNIEFQVSDVAKANTFVANMMLHHNADYIRETLGIEIKCIDYSGADRKIDSLKRVLRNALNELEQM